MIHTSFSTYVTVALIATGITAMLLLSGRRAAFYVYPYRNPIIGTSVKIGLWAASLLTGFEATYRHATLARAAANAHMSVTYILTCGFVATFAVVTVAALIFLAGRRF